MHEQTIVAPDVSGGDTGVGSVRAPRQGSADGSGRTGSGRRNVSTASRDSSGAIAAGMGSGEGPSRLPVGHSSGGRPDTAPDHASRRDGGIGGGSGQLDDHGRPATAREFSQRGYPRHGGGGGGGGGGGEGPGGGSGGGGGKPPSPTNAPSTSSRFPLRSNASMRPATSGSHASLSRSGGGGGGGGGGASSWNSFVERIPDRASDAVWRHKDISYRHDRVGHGAGNRTLRTGRQSMYFDTVLPPSLLEGNGNKEYRDGSRHALERLIRTVVDETGGGLGGLGGLGGSMTMSTGAGRPRTSGAARPGGSSPGRSVRSSSARDRFGRSGELQHQQRARGREGEREGGRKHSVEVSYASWVQAVGEGAEGRLPAGRSEVELLRAWMKAQLERTAAAAHDGFGDEPDPGDVAADIQEVYDRGVCELARQVTVHCAERGSFLSELWEGHTRVLGAVLQRLAQERKVLAENSMELLTRVASLERDKTDLLASNMELERANQSLREAMKATLKERDHATVEMRAAQQKLSDHVVGVELWLPQFSRYHQTEPFLEQLRANRGVPLASKMAKDPNHGPKLYAGGESLVANIERLVKMFIALSRGTPDEWDWEGKLVMALASAAGMNFDGDKGGAAMQLMHQALLEMEERLRRALLDLEDERYKRVMQDATIRETKDELAEMRKELIWRRAFNYCEWHPRNVQVQPSMSALVNSEPGKNKAKGRQIVPSSCIPAAFQLLFTTADAKDYIPKPRFPEKMTFMSRGAVIQLIKDITQAKLVLEDQEGNRELLPEFVYGFMLRKYGLVKMAEIKTVEFLASCLKHKLEAPRIMLFCRYLAMKGTERLSGAAFEFVLTTIRTVESMPETIADKFLDREAKKTLLSTPLTQQLAKDGGLERYVSADRASAAFKTLFKGKDKVVQEALEAIEAQSELEGAGHSFSFKKLAMQAVEGIAVSAWESAGDDHPSDLEEMFLLADENKDGVLTYEEFAKLMGKIKPELGLLKTLSIFREAVAESSSFSGDVITPDAFARVMSNNHITRAPTAANKDGGEEAMAIGSEREAFKIDYILLPRGFMDQYYLTLTKMFQAYGSAVSKVVEDFEVEGRMSLRDWISFCADAVIMGGPKGITKAKATAIFREANGGRFETDETGARVMISDHDADSMQYDEFKYGLALSAHHLYPDKEQLGEKIDALVEERVKKM